MAMKMGLVLALLVTAATMFCSSYANPEEQMNVPQIIKYWGYPAETHEAITKDGYILTLHRIPHGKEHNGKKSTTKQRPVVFLQHGLLCSSSNWVTNYPAQSLGFILADAGYDVWMGNVRGNTYSTKHIQYGLNSTEFWAFSWDEMAKYDLPAMINYALLITGKPSLYYVGHSQGTMMAFAGLAQDPELAGKVDMFFALAPVAKVANTKSPIRYLAYFTPLIKFLFGSLGIRDFMPSTKLVKWISSHVCPEELTVCDNVLFLVSGYDISNLNKSRTSVYFSHTPAGTSVQNVFHYSQMIKSGKFQAYDYGEAKNIAKYGTKHPKQYSLKGLKTRVIAFSGGQDWLADPRDVNWLMREIPHLVNHKKIPKYNHLDFIWGEDASKIIYKSMLRTMKKYEKAKKN
eukprot:gene11943-13179_t